MVEEVPAGPDVEEVPDPLERQVPMMREVLDAFGICVIGADGYEADDVIGTLATAPPAGRHGDRRPRPVPARRRRGRIRIVYIGKGSAVARRSPTTGSATSTASPPQYADFATMRGDASDGLPGVAGVGEKTAAHAAPALRRHRRHPSPRPRTRLDLAPGARQDQGRRRLPGRGTDGRGRGPRHRPRPPAGAADHAGRPRPGRLPRDPVGPRVAGHPAGRRACRTGS